MAREATSVLLLVLVAVTFSSATVEEGEVPILNRRIWSKYLRLRYWLFAHCVEMMTGDALWTIMKQWDVNFTTWKEGGDPCLGWEAVTCNQYGQVVALYVTFAPPRDLRTSYQLTIERISDAMIARNVSNRGLTGIIPREIGRLVHLETLDVSNAGSGGNASGTWYENYTTNSLKGPLPETLANCASLKSM